MPSDALMRPVRTGCRLPAGAVVIAPLTAVHPLQMRELFQIPYNLL